MKKNTKRAMASFAHIKKAMARFVKRKQTQKRRKVMSKEKLSLSAIFFLLNCFFFGCATEPLLMPEKPIYSQNTNTANFRIEFQLISLERKNGKIEQKNLPPKIIKNLPIETDSIFLKAAVFNPEKIPYKFFEEISVEEESFEKELKAVSNARHAVYYIFGAENEKGILLRGKNVTLRAIIEAEETEKNEYFDTYFIPETE